MTGQCLPNSYKLVPETCDVDMDAGGSITAGSINIIAELVDPKGVDSGKEAITLFNASANDISIDGWFILDGPGRKSLLKGKISAGSGKRIRLSGKGVILSNNGGKISLHDRQGVLMDEVKYSGRDVRSGWSIVF